MKKREYFMEKKPARAIALLPIGVFLVLYLGLGCLFEYGLKIEMGFYNIPIVVAFLAAILVACLQNRALSFDDKLEVMAKGVGDKNIMTMILIFLAALQDIPPSVYEAARVDSADGWERFWLVTLPMLAPMIQLNLVYTVLSSFSVADNAVLEFIQWLAFESGDAHGYEYSCAVSWIYCVFILLAIGLLVLLTRRAVENVKDR